MFLPGNAYSPMFVAGRGWYPLMFQSAALNPLYRQDRNHPPAPATVPPQFVTESMRPLHTGDFGGIWVKLDLVRLRPAAEHDGAQRPADLEQAHRQATAALVKRGKRPARQPKPAKPAPVMANQTAEGQP